MGDLKISRQGNKIYLGANYFILGAKKNFLGDILIHLRIIKYFLKKNKSIPRN